MREILFRGQVIRNDTMWVEGFYVHVPCGRFCCEEHLIQTIKEDGKMGSLFTCYESTIGQYTGRIDKNGKRVFEGDIIRLCNGIPGYDVGAILWDDNDQAYLIVAETTEKVLLDDFGNYGRPEYYEVIGNIHDNPELLKGE